MNVPVSRRVRPNLLKRLELVRNVQDELDIL